jgi:serine/threonine protein kinase
LSSSGTPDYASPEQISGGNVPLRDGDRIYLGGWTVITIIRD